MQENEQNFQQPQKKKKHRKVIWIIVIAILLIVIAAAAGVNGDSANTVEKIETDGTTTTSDEKTTDGTTTTSDEKTTDENQKIEAGNSVTTDELKISYVSCNANYKDYDDYDAPSDGNKVIRAEFEFENISSSDQSLSGFTCYANDKMCEEYYGADDYASPTLENISPGRILKSVVYFEVPKNADNIELEFESSFFSEEKIVFIVK